MNKNKFYYIFYFYFLSFISSVGTTQYTPSLPSGIKKRLVAGKRRAPVIEKSFIKKIIFLEPQKEPFNLKDQEEEIKAISEVNNIYIYDESENNGYRLTENMWNRSQTLKSMMEDLGWEEKKPVLSIARSFPYSADVIKTIVYILKVCENASKENPCNDAVKHIIESVSFETIVSALICMHDGLNIDPELLTELIEKVKQKITDLLNGVTISVEDRNALDAIELGSDLRKQLLGVTWEIFVEKFKLSVIKQCSSINPDNQPKPYTYGEDGDSILGVLFSPNNKYLSIKCHGFIHHPEYGASWPLKSSPVINMNTMYELKGVKTSNALEWIDSNTFICATVIDLSLKVFSCDGDEVAEKRKFELTRSLVGADIVYYQGKIMFTAFDYRRGIYIGFFNYNEPGDEVEYIDPRNINYSYLKIVKIDSSGIDMVSGTQNNRNEIELYKLGFHKKGTAITARFDKIAAFDGRFDSVITDVNKNKLAMIVGEDKLNVGIYSFETKSYTLFKGNKVISSLVFSPDGKTIIAACSDELSIISAITGEKIGMFSSAGGQIFDYNLCVAFSNSDGNTLAIGRKCNREEFLNRKGFLSGVTNYFREVIMMPSKPSSSRPNLLIWKWLPDKYVSIFKELQNKPLSFAYMKLLISLANQAKDNKNPILLTYDEAAIFDNSGNAELNLKIKNMLTDIHYVSFPATLLPEHIQPKINEWQE